MSLSHILLLAVIILIAVPPEKLPEILRNLGRLYNDIKRQTNGIWPDQEITDIKKHVQKALFSDNNNANSTPPQPPGMNHNQPGFNIQPPQANNNQAPGFNIQPDSSDKKENQG